MNIPLSSATPAKLYAFLLKLRPLAEGTLMPFNGELVHAAWLDWLGTAAPDVAAWLHEGNKRRLFTCSSLQFPLPQEKMLEVERRNVHWPLSPEKTYTIRVTLLLGELFPTMCFPTWRNAGTSWPRRTWSTWCSEPPSNNTSRKRVSLSMTTI